MSWHTHGFLTVDQVRLVGTDQEDKVPLHQPLHIVSRGEGNLALVILIIEIKKETRRSLFFLLLDRMFALSIARGKVLCYNKIVRSHTF